MIGTNYQKAAIHYVCVCVQQKVVSQDCARAFSGEPEHLPAQPHSENIISSPSRALVPAALPHCPRRACGAQLGTRRGSGGCWRTVLSEPDPHTGWGWAWGFLNPATWRREQQFSSSSDITEIPPRRKVVTTLVPKTGLALSSSWHGHPRVPAAG